MPERRRRVAEDPLELRFAWRCRGRACEKCRGTTDRNVLAEEVRRYTPAQVRQLLEGAGLVVERLSFAYASVFPLMLALRVGHRYFGRNGEAESGEWEIEVPPAPVNGVLTAVVGLEAMALRAVNMPFGSSIMCLARKPGPAASGEVRSARRR